MNDRERRFGERLARDIEQVLGVGIAIDDIATRLRVLLGEGEQR